MAVERSSITLKKQIELVLEQDPVPPSETQAKEKEQVENGIDIALIADNESFKVLQQSKKPHLALG